MAGGECRVCGSRDSTLLHNVPHLGVFAALCTACVLRLNPGSFCPVCFNVYDENTSSSCIMCVRCPALAHLTCLPSARRYLCPHCSDSSFSFSDAASTVSLTKKLICAAEISAACMHRAAAVARADAEQKVMTAVLAKRNAKEAIERVANLIYDPILKD